MKKKTKKLMSPKEAWLWRQMVGMADRLRNWCFVAALVTIALIGGTALVFKLIFRTIKDARDGGWNKWR